MARVTSTSPGRRGRLLDAAARLFVRWGFDKTSVDDIAREAGVSKGAVYLEFPNKETLFKATLHREYVRYSGDWLRRFEADPGEWSFARMFQHSIAAVHANPLMKALLTRDQALFGSYLRRDPEWFGVKTSMEGELFLRLQEVGVIREDIPAGVIAYLTRVIGYGMVAGNEAIPKENRVSFEESVTALGLLLDRGLSPSRIVNRKAGRALIVDLVAKMHSALRAAADHPSEHSAFARSA